MKTVSIRPLAGCLIVVAMIVFAAPPAGAQVGLRGGLSADPDQLYFGAHVDAGPVFDRFLFRPNLEVGFGNDAVVAAMNGEFLYPFQLDNGTRLHVGVGPAVNVISFDRLNRNDTIVGPGLNFLIGFSFSRNYFAELKVGAIDSPQVKIGIGYTFSED